MAEFTIIIDTREQRPFNFGPDVPTVRGTLPTGDYAVDGLPACVVERKAPNDLIGCMTHDRERFTRELERLQAPEYEFSAVVVEADLPMLMTDLWGRMPPASKIGTLIAWAQRYPRTHWLFAPTREWAARLTFKILDRFFRDVRDGKRPAPAREVAA